MFLISSSVSVSLSDNSLTSSSLKKSFDLSSDTFSVAMSFFLFFHFPFCSFYILKVSFLNLWCLVASTLSAGPFIFSKASFSNNFLSAGSGDGISSWGKASKFFGTNPHLGLHIYSLGGCPGIGKVQWHRKLAVGLNLFAGLY